MSPPVIFDISGSEILSFFRDRKFDPSIAASVAQRGHHTDTLFTMGITPTEVYDTAMYQLTLPDLLEWHPYFRDLVKNVEPILF